MQKANEKHFSGKVILSVWFLHTQWNTVSNTTWSTPFSLNFCNYQ